MGVCFSLSLEPIRSLGWRTVPLPMRHLFHLVQPWAGLAGGKSKRCINASDRHPLRSSVHHHPPVISPTSSLSKPNTAEHMVTFENSGAIRGPNLTVKTQTPEAEFSSFVVSSSSPPPLQWCSCSSKPSQVIHWIRFTTKYPSILQHQEGSTITRIRS